MISPGKYQGLSFPGLSFLGLTILGLGLPGLSFPGLSSRVLAFRTSCFYATMLANMVIQVTFANLNSAQQIRPIIFHCSALHHPEFDFL